MALNVKILYPLDHPMPSTPIDEGSDISASSSELDTDKENMSKKPLLESEEDHLYKNKDLKKKKLNIIT